jgi:hypothetical protein
LFAGPRDVLIAGTAVVFAGVAMAVIGPWIYGAPERHIRPASRLVRVGAPVWLSGLLALGAIAASGSTSAAGTPTGLAGVDGFTHVHSGAGGIEAGNGSSPCEVSGPPVSNGQAAGGHGHRGPSLQSAIDDPATRALLGQQLVTARAAAMRYPTVATAEAAGYRKVTDYLACIGAHYIKASLVDAKFDPAQPEMLLYDSTQPDGRIVGLSYYVLSGSTAPAGFAGPNDTWHQHIGLCVKYGVVIGPERWSEARCERAGGHKADGSSAWMVHAWVVPGWESAWGTFSGEHPELGAVVEH